MKKINVSPQKVFSHKVKKNRAVSTYLHALNFFLPTICYAAIVFLAFADASTLNQMFAEQLDIGGFGSWPISITYAICLEGLPIAFSSAWCTLHDDGIASAASKGFKKGKSFRQKKAQQLFWFSLIVFIFVAVYVVHLRYKSIVGNSSMVDWNRNSTPAQMAVMLSPVFSSLGATALSMLANKSYSVDSYWKRAKRAQHDYTVRRSAFMDSYTRLDGLRVALWSSLVNDKPQPTKARLFRKQCLERIRCKLLSDCAMAYPHHLNHFNAEIECALSQYIESMSHLTTIPEEFRSLNIQQLIDEYDSHFQENVDKWDYHKSNDAMLQELINLLNNELLIRQYRATAEKNISSYNHCKERKNFL